MSPNKRIALNVIATYGRSLYALIIGVFSGRWMLMALGTSDYGLIGLVGGLVTFVSVFNTILASAVGRFYAVSVGSARKEGNYERGLQECQKWFNTALLLHTIVPLCLVVVGYPLGVWAISHILSIPEGRFESCLWIWRFTCCSCVVGMMSVPFNAMYTAKQEIAELTVYGVVSTTLNAIVLCYMASHPGIWLVKYSAWAAIIAVGPQAIITYRAFRKYPECKFVGKFLFNINRLKGLVRFCAARFWSDFSNMISAQGQAILVNRNMGLEYNASMTVASSVAAHTMTLANSLSGAFWPAIANKCGEANREEAMKLQEMASRLGAILVLIFALPLSIEIEEVLRLWLVTPPPFAGVLVVAILFRMACLRMTDGYWMAILGFGKGVVRYSWTVGWAEIGLVAVAAIGFLCGCGMWSIVGGYLFSAAGCVIVRLWYGRSMLDIGIRQWLSNVAMPIFGISVIVVVAGLVVKSAMNPSILRVILTTTACETVFIPLVWKGVLRKPERLHIMSAARNLWRRAV